MHLTLLGRCTYVSSGSNPVGTTLSSSWKAPKLCCELFQGVSLSQLTAAAEALQRFGAAQNLEVAVGKDHVTSRCFRLCGAVSTGLLRSVLRGPLMVSREQVGVIAVIRLLVPVIVCCRRCMLWFMFLFCFRKNATAGMML